MDNLKSILKIIAIILGIVLALAVVGLVLTALQYIFWLGLLGLAVVVAVKLFGKSDVRQLESKGPLRTLKETERSLEEYKRKYLAK